MNSPLRRGRAFFLGFLDLLQGVDQHLVVVAVPGLLDVRDALAEVVEVGGRERAAENQ